MARTRTGEEPVLPAALVTVHPLPGAFVPGEPHITHEVTPERAAELIGMPVPAFSLTPPDEGAATTPGPAEAAGQMTEV